MIIFVHQKGEKLLVVRRGKNIVPIRYKNFCLEFFRIAAQYPNELILWVENEFESYINFEKLSEIFSHSLIMSSYAIKDRSIPLQIGYVDQYPFVKPNLHIKYPTWMMSTDIGGINSNTLSAFRSLFKNIKDFHFLINSIAKLGQQNSLFCYSDPRLLKLAGSKTINSRLDSSFLFKFVGAHYKKEWLVVLFFALLKYENIFPFLSLLKGLFQQSYSNKELRLNFEDKNVCEFPETIDVIIPTLGRPDYLFDFLNDLKNQSHLPNTVIIVEQNSDVQATTELSYLQEENWPFEINHSFTNHLGACRARNMALKVVKSKWIFLADDDIRIKEDLLKNAITEAKRLKVDCLNLNCLEPGAETIFHKIKQWASFGSGTSIVKSAFAMQCNFNEVYEKGFGEDIDFGLQLRNKGCDIIFHPSLITTHLKAPRGGFRDIMIDEIEDFKKPKPSPTMMRLVKSNLTIQMLRGYKMSLFLKFFIKQPIKNPFKYHRMMRYRWQLSEELSKQKK